MTNKAFKIEMLVTSLLTKEELEKEFLNVLQYMERRDILVRGISWFRMAEEK